MQVIIIILQILFWIVQAAMLIAYWVIESSVSIQYKGKDISARLRFVFIPVIGIIFLALLGWGTGSFWFVIYLGALFLYKYILYFENDPDLEIMNLLDQVHTSENLDELAEKMKYLLSKRTNTWIQSLRLDVDEQNHGTKVAIRLPLFMFFLGKWFRWGKPFSIKINKNKYQIPSDLIKEILNHPDLDKVRTYVSTRDGEKVNIRFV